MPQLQHTISERQGSGSLQGQESLRLTEADQPKPNDTQTGYGDRPKPTLLESNRKNTPRPWRLLPQNLLPHTFHCIEKREWALRLSKKKSMCSPRPGGKRQSLT